MENEFAILSYIENVSIISSTLLILLFVISNFNTNSLRTIKALCIILYAVEFSVHLNRKFGEFIFNNDSGQLALLVSQLILTSVIYLNFFWQKKHRVITKVGILIFMIFFIISSIAIPTKPERIHYLTILSCVTLITYSIIFFYLLLTTLPTIHLHRYFLFWFNASVFNYFGFSLIIMTFIVQWLKSDSEGFLIASAFLNFENIVRNAMVALGLCISKNN